MVFDPEALLEGAAAETGWNDLSKITILLRFIESEFDSQDRVIGERFERFLDEQVVEELGESIEEDEDDDDE